MKNKMKLKTIQIITIFMIVITSIITVNAQEDQGYDEENVESLIEDINLESDVILDPEYEGSDMDTAIFEPKDLGEDYSQSTFSLFAAPTNGPYVGDFSLKKGGSSTVDVYQSSTGNGTLTYLTNNDSSGVFPILDEANNRYKIAISGEIGWVAKSLVTLTKFVDANAKGSVDFYTVSNGDIYHYISKGANQTQLSIINNGKLPSDLKLSPGVEYLSYDGHYFYPFTTKGMNDLISDYNTSNNSRSKSVNPNTPFYNYFQWLPARTQTNLTTQDFRNYLVSRGYNSTYISRLFETEQLFMDNGDYFGGNSALGFATAIHESGWGTSTYSRNRNNYFGHNAVDSNPGLAHAYSTPNFGIGNHFGGFWNWNYLNPNPIVYNYGGSVGDKSSGMNVKYASDAYWGEKIAAHLYNLDKLAGFKDYGEYTIGMTTTLGVKYYAEANNSGDEALYKARRTKTPIAILNGGKTVQGRNINGNNKWYESSSEAVLTKDKKIAPYISGESKNYSYDFAGSTVFSHESVVEIVFKGKNSNLKKQVIKPLKNEPKLESKSIEVFVIKDVEQKPDPSNNYSSIQTIKKSDKVIEVVLTNNNGAQVLHGDGSKSHIGYISTDSISLTKGGAPISKTDYIPLDDTKPVVPKPPVDDFVKGDVSGNGVLNSQDYMIIKNYILGKRKLNAAELKRADITGEGKVNSQDYMRIKNIILGRR